jgi:DNA mismatch endonuclease, patch repair protein
MIDVVDKATRSRMMSGIQGKNTKPELLVRKYLHGRGLRFRLHAKELPGKPDLVFPKYKAVVFVHGCFWHGHECQLFKWPQTRAKFWKDKIHKNRANDKRAVTTLMTDGWRVCVVWECALRNNKNIEVLLGRVAEWLRGTEPYFEQQNISSQKL